MKDETLLKIVTIPCVLVGYGIYTVNNPGADGYAFGTMMGLLGLLAGIKLTEGSLRQDK